MAEIAPMWQAHSSLLAETFMRKIHAGRGPKALDASELSLAIEDAVRLKDYKALRAIRTELEAEELSRHVVQPIMHQNQSISLQKYREILQGKVDYITLCLPKQ